jgi:glycosyltransferase involved in cell wall biosynthesis
MSNKPLSLSIVIPVFNEERYLNACLDSVACQSVKPDEVIVVDNNSTDKSAVVTKKYKFARLVKEPRQGIVYARDTGFDAAKSELIGRIDADCILDGDWVKNVKEHYKKAGLPELYVATGPSDFQNPGGRHTWYPFHRIFYFWASSLLLGHHTISGSNMFMTKKLWLHVRKKVCVRTDIHEDMDLAVHVRSINIPIVFSKDFKDSMLGRNVGHKLWTYLPMFLRIRLVKHG